MNIGPETYNCIYVHRGRYLLENIRINLSNVKCQLTNYADNIINITTAEYFSEGFFAVHYANIHSEDVTGTLQVM